MIGDALSGGAAVLAQDDGATLLLGDDFFPWIVLALGAAMVVGTVVALVRPPAEGASPPIGRAVVMILLGAIAAVWGLASLLTPVL